MDGTLVRSRVGNRLRWAPDSLRPDASGEPLIAPGSVLGLWPVTHWLSIAPHDHEFYEIALILQGTGHHYAGDQEQDIEPGSVIFVPPWISHGYRALRDVTLYNCFFRAELAQNELIWASRDTALAMLFGQNASVAASARPLVIHLEATDLDSCIQHLDAVRNCAPGDRSRATELGHLLLVLDIIARRATAETPITLRRSPATPRPVASALDLINADPSRDWKLSELSQEVYVGQYHLAHEFKRWVGIAPIAYLNQRRAEWAALLLAGTDDSIGSIGRAVGWAEPASFSRHFRRAFGVSPRDYRRRISGAMVISEAGPSDGHGR